MFAPRTKHPKSVNRDENPAPVIDACALAKKHGDAPAVEQVTLAVRKGELFGFPGPCQSVWVRVGLCF